MERKKIKNRLRYVPEIFGLSEFHLFLPGLQNQHRSYQNLEISEDWWSWGTTRRMTQWRHKRIQFWEWTHQNFKSKESFKGPKICSWRWWTNNYTLPQLPATMVMHTCCERLVKSVTSLDLFVTFDCRTNRCPIEKVGHCSGLQNMSDHRE